jgi:hypothetical protein
MAEWPRRIALCWDSAAVWGTLRLKTFIVLPPERVSQH